MIAELVIFIILGTFAVATAIAVVLSKNPVYAILFLVMNFFVLALFFLLLSAQFVAFLQVLIYAGAIMVLFLFVVMLLNLTGGIEAMQDKLPAQKWLALLFAVLALVEAGIVVMTTTFPRVSTPIPQGFGNVEQIGKLLFTKYLFPFEATSVLLVIAMVGSIVLARRRA